MLFSDPLDRSSIPITRYPFVKSRSRRCDPINPAIPVTRMYLAGVVEDPIMVYPSSSLCLTWSEFVRFLALLIQLFFGLGTPPGPGFTGVLVDGTGQVKHLFEVSLALHGEKTEAHQLNAQHQGQSGDDERMRKCSVGLRGGKRCA